MGLRVNQRAARTTRQRQRTGALQNLARVRSLTSVATILGIVISNGCMDARGFAAEAPPEKPTLYLIGDSTVNTPTKGQLGWGRPIAGLFDTNRITVLNKARG